MKDRSARPFTVLCQSEHRLTERHVHAKRIRVDLAGQQRLHLVALARLLHAQRFDVRPRVRFDTKAEIVADIVSPRARSA